MKSNRTFVFGLAALLLTALLQGCGEHPVADMLEIGSEQDNPADQGLEDAQRGAAPDEAGAPLEDREEESTASIAKARMDAAVSASQQETADLSSTGSETDSIPDNTQENTLYLHIGEQTLTATLVDNSSTAALKELLAEGSITMDMRDYGNFEKVGELSTDLPTNDASITTEPGDLILYQGTSFVIYYAPNSWSLTKLGKIDGVTGDELKELLGAGDLRVTLSLT